MHEKILSNCEKEKRSRSRRVTDGIEKCCCLEEGWVKVNGDSAFSQKSERAGIGVVIRDDEGALMDGVGGEVKADSALMTEALACREGLKLAVNRKYAKVEIEMDLEVLFSYLTKPRIISVWKLRPVL